MRKRLISVLSYLGFCMGMIPRVAPEAVLLGPDEPEEDDRTLEVAMDWDILVL